MLGFRGLLTFLARAAASVAAGVCLSSPVSANGKLDLAAGNDDVMVARTGEKFDVLATNSRKDQTLLGAPAILDGEIYLRGPNTLFCIR